MDDLRDLASRGRSRSPTRIACGRADDHAGRLEADVEAVRAEVALLGRVVLGVDVDRVVRAGGDAGLAADADRLSKSTMPSGRRYIARVGQACDARRVGALVAAGDLEGAARLRESPDSTYLT